MDMSSKDCRLQGMATYIVKVKHDGTGIVYVVPVLAKTLAEAKVKAVNWPYFNGEAYSLVHEVTT